VQSDYLKAESIAYPEPHDFKFDFSETPLSVYEGEIFIGALLKVSENVSPGEYPVVVTLDYQACNDMSCLAPTSISDTITLIVADKQSVVHDVNQAISQNINLVYTPITTDQPEVENFFASTFEGSAHLIGLFFLLLACRH